MDVEELVMPAGGTHQHPKPMVPVNRPVGQNDVGMIAWVLTLRTPECPQGRKVGIRFLIQPDLASQRALAKPIRASHKALVLFAPCPGTLLKEELPLSVSRALGWQDLLC